MRSAPPDRHALERAHQALQSAMPLDTMLAIPALRIILENRARAVMARRMRFDPKRLQANDHDN
jgi:hypothetical protein